MKRVCVDSGFLIALYDESDCYNSKAKEYFANYLDNSNNQLLIPWPILYETVSTRMTKDKRRINALHRNWKYLESQRRLILLDDKEFRSDAFDECLAEVQKIPQHYRPLSLTDRVIRKILSEINIKIDLFITFNPKDFVDVCKRSHRILVQ
jgi:predicted nucleic acid-binding protein